MPRIRRKVFLMILWGILEGYSQETSRHVFYSLASPLPCRLPTVQNRGNIAAIDDVSDSP